MAAKQAIALNRKRAGIYNTARIIIMAAFYALPIAFYRMISIPKWLISMLPQSPYFSLSDYVAIGFILLWICIPTFWDWSGKLAAKICCPPDLSLQGTQVESITRNDGFRQVRVTSKPLIISKYGMQLVFPATYTFIAFLFGYMLFDGPHAIDSDWLFVALISFSSGVSAIIAWINVDKPLIKADSEGIQYRNMWGLTCKFIPWDHVYFCDAIKVCNMFGKVVSNSIVLQNIEHKKLLKITIATSTYAVNYRNTRQLVKFIRQVFSNE
jgi:hypothetical protein